MVVKGHAASHTRHNGQVGRHQTCPHEEDNVLVSDEREAAHQLPEALLGRRVLTIEGVDHDVPVPTPSETHTKHITLRQ